MILDNLRGALGYATESTSGASTVTLTDGTTTTSTYTKFSTMLHGSNTSIVVGRGTDPVIRADYKLADQITEGILESNKSKFYETGTTKSITMYRFSSIIENTSSEAITITEIGLMYTLNSDATKQVLLIRENVDPYVLQPNESVQISISIN